MVLPAQRLMEVAAQCTQQIIVVLLPTGVHGRKLLFQMVIGLGGDLQLTQAPGRLPTADGAAVQPLLDQSGRQGKAGVQTTKAVKGAGGTVQTDGGMGVAVVGGQVNEPGKLGPGAGEENIYRFGLRHMDLVLSGFRIADRI